LAERDEKLSKTEGELIVLSTASANQEMALQEQSEAVKRLELAVEAERRALEMERKQVEGEPLFDSCLVGFSVRGLAFPFLISSLSWRFQACAPPWGTQLSGAEALQASYNSSEQELRELRGAALETCRAVEEGEAHAGSSLASRLRALGGHVTERMRRALHLGVQKAL
jgi:hypothetical protein